MSSSASKSSSCIVPCQSPAFVPEHDPISGTKAGLWHGTMQDDDLLAEDDIFREEGGAGLEDRTECAQDGLEDFDKDRGKSRVGSTPYGVIAANRRSASSKARR